MRCHQQNPEQLAGKHGSLSRPRSKLHEVRVGPIRGTD
jgi:hypothetical protein